MQNIRWKVITILVVLVGKGNADLGDCIGRLRRSSRVFDQVSLLVVDVDVGVARCVDGQMVWVREVASHLVVHRQLALCAV